jgi:hypothetical protein
MTAHSTAQGIASLGRYGDDLIVHMNQEEVQGLQALAKKHGTSLTINPDTGMPEAFKLGNVFKAVLPIAAGFALGPGGFGLFSSPIMAGLAVGATTGILTGNLGQGLMAGLGAYGGFGMGDTLAKMGATTAGGMTPTMTANVTQAATGAPLVGASSQFISPFTPQGVAGGAGLGVGTVGGGAANAITNQAVNASLTGANSLANAGAAPISGFAKSYEGVKNLFSPGGYDQLKNVLGTEVAATPDKIQNVSLGGQSGTITTPGTPATIKPATNMDVIKKIGMPVAGAVLQGVEPSDFYEDTITPQEKQSYEQTGVDAMGRPTYGYVKASGFNPYRTLNLGGPSPLNLGAPAKSYATGGTIQSGGIRDLYGTPDNQPTISPGLSGFGLGRLNNLAGEQALDKAKTLGYAEGGETSLNLEDQPTLNLKDQPSLNVETGRQNYTTPESFFRDFYTGNMPFDLAGPPGQLYSYVMKGKLNDGSTIGQNLYDQMMKSRTRMAKGGYLDGAGDGMSDSIPATIEGKQPARLADGEFVVPADVVSHLGNGSSKAGSKRLYAMMQKVRKARTGNPKQGKQINPNKYLMA